MNHETQFAVFGNRISTTHCHCQRRYTPVCARSWRTPRARRRPRRSRWRSWIRWRRRRCRRRRPTRRTGQTRGAGCPRGPPRSPEDLHWNLTEVAKKKTFEVAPLLSTRTWKANTLSMPGRTMSFQLFSDSASDKCPPVFLSPPPPSPSPTTVSPPATHTVPVILFDIPDGYFSLARMKHSMSTG